MLTKERKGEMAIFSSALLWGLFPVITILSYNNVSPLVSLTGSTLLSAIFFVSIIAWKKKWKEIKDKQALKDIIWTTVFLAILFYILFFFGLKYTSAGNASIIALAETLFSYLFFNIWKKENISKEHILGSILMIAGALIVLSSNFTKFQGGDLLILLASMIAPFGNFFQRRARQRVSSETIMFVRSLIAAPAILILAFLFGERTTVSNLADSILFLLINGFILFGLTKILWIEGIHRISVTKSNALSAVSPLFTLIFAWLILKQFPTSWQLLSFLPMAGGVILLGKNNYKSA